MAVKAGHEIDAYCTKCKMDLLHRIVAVVGVKPVKVECRTCKTVHLYRAPRTATATAPAPSSIRGTTGSSTASAPSARPARRERASSAVDHISLEPPSGSRVHPYRMTDRFMKDQWLQHKTFGIGLVLSEVGTDKIEVRFEVGVKVLVHGHSE